MNAAEHLSTYFDVDQLFARRRLVDYAAYKDMLTDVIRSMQTPNFYPHSLAVKSGANEPLRTSVAHLFSRAQNLPCSTAAQSYMQLVPTTLRFSLALEVVFPLLDAPIDVSA